MSARNCIHLVGNLTDDPDIKSTATGNVIATFTLAVNRDRKDKDGKYPTDFMNIVAWNQLAEICNRFLRKGNKAVVSGRLQSRKYEDKQGIKRTIWEIAADSVELISPRGSAQGEDKTQSDYGDYSADVNYAELTEDGLPW